MGVINCTWAKVMLYVTIQNHVPPQLYSWVGIILGSYKTWTGFWTGMEFGISSLMA